MPNLTAVLADDQPVFRSIVARLLKPNFELLASASDGVELMALIRALHPDVVISDIRMPNLNGIEAIAQAQAAGTLDRGQTPRTAVVFLTIHEDQTLVERALGTGALGYVLKPRAALDLLPAIAAACKGEKFVSPPLIIPM
ncbi:MAG: response regulator transcription factor [Bryobacterales bacterium]